MCQQDQPVQYDLDWIHRAAISCSPDSRRQHHAMDHGRGWCRSALPPDQIHAMVRLVMQDTGEGEIE
eukprot:9075004-Prorocentrum_lima.AAC.1